VIVGLKMVNQLRLWRNNFLSGFTYLAARLRITGGLIQKEKKIQNIFFFCHISFELKGFNPSNNWTLKSQKDWKFSCGVDQFWTKNSILKQFIGCMFYTSSYKKKKKEQNKTLVTSFCRSYEEQEKLHLKLLFQVSQQPHNHPSSKEEDKTVKNRRNKQILICYEIQMNEILYYLFYSKVYKINVRVMVWW
jgi:hypothetical protein